MLVTPGLIDMHVHFREPGYENEETIRSGSHAALAGGFTTVACMPNTNPVNDCPEVTKLIKRKAKLLNVVPIGAITKGLEGKLPANSGCYFVSDDGKPVVDAHFITLALLSGNLVILHEEPEVKMLKRDIELLRYWNGAIHVAHVSLGETVDLIRKAKAEGLRITCETTPHHAILTNETKWHVNPPLRSKEDVKAIQQGLKDGTIDCISSDHSPHDNLDANGNVGLETSFPVCYTYLVKPGILTFNQLLDKMVYNPAILLEANIDGTSAVFEEKKWKVKTEDLHSKGVNCVWNDFTLDCKCVKTCLGGRTVYDSVRGDKCFKRN